MHPVIPTIASIILLTATLITIIVNSKVTQLTLILSILTIIPPLWLITALNTWEWVYYTQCKTFVVDDIALISVDRQIINLNDRFSRNIPENTVVSVFVCPKSHMGLSVKDLYKTFPIKVEINE